MWKGQKTKWMMFFCESLLGAAAAKLSIAVNPVKITSDTFLFNVKC